MSRESESAEVATTGYPENETYLLTTNRTSSGYSAGAGLGVSFERDLGRNFAVRFSTLFASITYAKATATVTTSDRDEALPSDADDESLAAGIEFVPQLTLRLLW